MILEIIKYGNPVLRQKGAAIEKITPEIKKLIADMFETMRERHGVGLAAQQIGCALQLTVIDVRDGSQHSAARSKSATALIQLGVGYPPAAGWPAAWSVVSARTIEALDAIREELVTKIERVNHATHGSLLKSTQLVTAT